MLVNIPYMDPLGLILQNALLLINQGIASVSRVSSPHLQMDFPYYNDRLGAHLVFMTGVFWGSIYPKNPNQSLRVGLMVPKHPIPTS